MGWYGSRCSRREKIAELTADNSAAKCVRHCYRGNNFSGVLWSVWEGASGRHIACDVLSFRGGCWWNKPMDEAMHPFYYSCPLGYLEQVPVACEEWRQGVRDYHAKRKKVPA